MAAAATLPPRVSTLAHGPRVLGAAAPAAEALGLGAAMRDRPLGPLSPNPDDWGQYVDDDEPPSPEEPLIKPAQQQEVRARRSSRPAASAR